MADEKKDKQEQNPQPKPPQNPPPRPTLKLIKESYDPLEALRSRKQEKKE